MSSYNIWSCLKEISSAHIDPEMNSQDFHVAKAEEGSVHQPGEAVPVQMQRAEGGQILESQAIHPANLVSAQVPATNTALSIKRGTTDPMIKHGKVKTHNFHRNGELTDAAGWATGRTWPGY